LEISTVCSGFVERAARLSRAAADLVVRGREARDWRAVFKLYLFALVLGSQRGQPKATPSWRNIERIVSMSGSFMRKSSIVARLPAATARDDVIDGKGRHLASLREPAILAAVFRALDHRKPKGLGDVAHGF
jgi:hypothetical protein